MSYILEALKKAQAERQLGALPTIHAPPIQGSARGVAGGPLNNPLWLALGLMTLVALTLLVLMWRQPEQSASPAPTPPQARVAAAVAVPLPGVPVGAVAVVPKIAPRALVLAPVKAVAAATPTPVPLVKKPQRMPAPVPVAAAVAATEEAVLTLRELPEPIQRQIPPIAIGGYMYSKNPADRLLLIDKVLRHEGEELAPGLTLEKLQPNSAEFNYKGYRYRVPY